MSYGLEISELAYDTKVFKFLDYATQVFLDDGVMAQNLNLESWRDEMLGGVVYRLKAKLLAEELVTDRKNFRFTFSHSVEVPDGWWQAYKQEHYPNWLKKIYPVRTKTITESFTAKRSVDFTKYATYPKAMVKYPDLGRPVYKFAISESE